MARVLEFEFSRRHRLDAYTSGLENPLMDRQPVVICNQLCKNYGSTPVVRDLDLAILPGTCYGLLGPNGAGKTTTLRMLLGLSPPTSGTLKVFDKDITAHPREIRARTGVVPQADNLILTSRWLKICVSTRSIFVLVDLKWNSESTVC